MEPVYSAVIGFARGVFAAQGLKFRLEGESNIPRTGGAVLMINHTGYMDFTYAGLVAVRSKRFVRFMAKNAIWKNPVAGPLMTGMKHIPVDREAGAGSYAAALAALRSGELVGVFPEATISRSFELKAFKNGGVRMAQQAGVPVIPVTIWGSQRVWTKGHPKRLGRTNVPIHIVAGTPVAVGPEDSIDEVTAQLKAVMDAQLKAQQEVYPAWPEEDLHLLPRRLGGTAPTLEEADTLDAADVAQRLAARREQALRRKADRADGGR